MSDGVKLGQLLCDADIITKRQLSKALPCHVKGNKGHIGEIIVEMNFCDFDDIPDALMNSETDTHTHCLIYTTHSPRDRTRYRMPSSA